MTARIITSWLLGALTVFCWTDPKLPVFGLALSAVAIIVLACMFVNDWNQGVGR